MFSAVSKEVTSLLDRRFLLNAFFPSLIFWGLLALVVAVGQGNLITTVKTWNQQEETVKVVQIIGFVAWVTFFAGIVSSQLTAILRFYEGYWTFPFGQRLHTIGKGWHQARLHAIGQDADSYEEIYLSYPPDTRPEEVMPTRLGNILKNAELYPLIRYEMDAVLLWPRLYNLFPERFIQTIAEARAAVDFMLVLSALSGVFALLAGSYLLIVGAAWWFFLGCFWGGLLVAWLAYTGALGSALLYAQQIKVAFDLYRNELLKQMHLPLPATPNEEKTKWHEVGQFFYRNVREQPGLWTYTDAPPALPVERKETWLQKLLRCLGLYAH